MTQRTALPATLLDDHLVETIAHWIDKFVAQVGRTDSHRHLQGWLRKLVREDKMPLRRLIELTRDRGAAIDADAALRDMAEEMLERGEVLPQLLVAYLVGFPKPVRGRGRRESDWWLRDQCIAVIVGVAMERWGAVIPLTRNPQTAAPSICSLVSRACRSRGIKIGVSTKTAPARGHGMKQQSAAQGRKHASPDAAVKDQAVRTFTSQKIDWMDAVCGDPRLRDTAVMKAFEIAGPAVFMVAYRIANRVNMATGEAFISDETLSDQTGLTPRSVRRARIALRDLGWLAWRRRPMRTSTGIIMMNAYSTLTGPMNAATDHQIMLKDKRKAARVEREKGNLTGRLRPFTRQTDRTPTSTPGPDAYVRHSPRKSHLTESTASTKKVVVVEGEIDAAKFYFVEELFDPADIPEPPPHQSIPDLVDVDNSGARQARRAAIFAQARATLRDPDPDPDPEPDEEADEDDLEPDDDDGAPSYTPRPPRQQKYGDAEFEGGAS